MTAFFAAWMSFIAGFIFGTLWRRGYRPYVSEATTRERDAPYMVRYMLFDEGMEVHREVHTHWTRGRAEDHWQQLNAHCRRDWDAAGNQTRSYKTEIMDGHGSELRAWVWGMTS